MKTSELKRILWEDCVEIYIEIDDIIYGMCWAVWKREQFLQVNGVVPLGVLKVLGEYTNTPLDEREDEKKYRIESLNIVYKSNDNLYLIREYTNGVFLLTVDYYDAKKFQALFTQSEIDNFPAEIKGAIECGFLRKVEVE